MLYFWYNEMLYQDTLWACFTVRDSVMTNWYRATWTQIQNQTYSLYVRLQFMCLRPGWLMAVQFPLTACSTQVRTEVKQHTAVGLGVSVFPRHAHPHAHTHSTPKTVKYYLYISSDSVTFNPNTSSCPNDPTGQLPRTRFTYNYQHQTNWTAIVMWSMLSSQVKSSQFYFYGAKSQQKLSNDSCTFEHAEMIPDLFEAKQKISS